LQQLDAQRAEPAPASMPADRPERSTTALPEAAA
jgi:hypothetical protein